MSHDLYSLKEIWAPAACDGKMLYLFYASVSKTLTKFHMLTVIWLLYVKYRRDFQYILRDPGTVNQGDMK